MKHSYTAPSLHRTHTDEKLRREPKSSYVAPLSIQDCNGLGCSSVEGDRHKPSRFTLTKGFSSKKSPKGYNGWSESQLTVIRNVNLARFQEFATKTDEAVPETQTQPRHGHCDGDDEQPNLNPNSLWRWTAPRPEEEAQLDKHSTPRWGNKEDVDPRVQLKSRDRDEVVRRAHRRKPRNSKCLMPDGEYPQKPPTLPCLLPGGRAPLAWENALFISRLEEVYFSNTNAGLEHSRAREYERAALCYKRALDAASKLQHAPKQNMAFGNLGLVTYKLGEFLLSEQWFLHHLELSTFLKDQKGCYRAWKHLGQIATQDGRHEEASEYFKRSLDISNGVGGLPATQHVQGVAKMRVGLALGNAQVTSTMKRMGQSLSEKVLLKPEYEAPEHNDFDNVPRPTSSSQGNDEAFFITEHV